ncbi:oxysterol-binding protein-related protein 9 [Odontomachus brunneus]|uniref:oxysterol-binding protein-related protein 9 n=1 Tax=Odontomachus brunneus TaxID=486640 RepID=UPI0013F267F0|nr:oxysterol-binding protein-related protein 9 [Odontomachus brunneus]XP_032673208.1 oxysterol-binding protein-related protein 9 [Odontomachus brunneus]
MSTMEGSLSKWTNVVNGWQYRWFVLDDNAGLLSYYTSKEKMMRGARRGCVRLRGAIIGIDDEDDSTFTITTSSCKDDPKTFHFQTRNGEERERWIRALEDTILRHSNARWDPKKSLPKQDFDRKVAEADAYLQLLIEQIKLIENKKSAVEEDEEKQKKYSAVLLQANAMLNSVKHTIVQLQIAKNTAIPVNGVYRGPSNSIHVPPTLSHVAARAPEATVQTGIELGSECVEPRVPTLSNVVDRDLPVPQFSYSSSDEDDDYFDAADEIPTPISQNHITLRSDNERFHVSTESATGDKRKEPPLPPIKGDGSVDYDALYEEESETEMDSMESHGSVVTHLLSQVKIGMDLTKVALPTFILERRSLLEMYADYFAHPDQFVSIADMPTPRERMVQVIRWYLCSFHAGRKSGVAKKPYNPILGEIFRCHWNIPNTSSSDNITDSGSKLISDGPVPWCKENQLAFLAEQVSHHPPVSAFYAEHVGKKICFGAHVWTKSKFLGLSIGVHNVGKGWVNVLQHGEEYVLTFPNGYGRSILTVPWIELGGSVTISCLQSGYHATVEFLTKPFYGGKRNRITCQAFQAGDKKPFLVINGEWSGMMEAKWSDGKSEIFSDVKELSTERKLVKTVCEQEECESRRVWRDVTVGLRINDMDKATAAKCAIEQKQRDEARVRKENNITWQTKLFKETKDGGWVYIKPLVDRIRSSSDQTNVT